MQVSTAIAIYFLIWWLTLFAVLPFGVRSQHESGEELTPGSDPGAPMMPRILVKLLWTTVVASVIFAGLYVIYTYRLITLEDLKTWTGSRV